MRPRSESRVTRYHRESNLFLPMRNPKALCLFTTILGNKATAQYLQSALERIPNLEARFEFLTIDDYQRYPAPVWERLTNPWHSQYLFRQKFGQLLNEDFDLILTNAWEFAIPLRRAARRVPAAILMDSTPYTANRHRVRLGKQNLRRSIAHQIHHWEFLRAVRNFRYFFPMGSSCRDALLDVYGVRADRCFITLAPQDTARWKQSERPPSHSPFRLLFVTNDFVRKGGHFLLECFRRFRVGICDLTIVSNDQAVGAVSLPQGTSWLRGNSKEELLDIYQRSDLFVFPTRQDYMPQVVAEALSTGLPVIAASVGDIPDLVRHGENGFLMAADASAELWANTIQGLIDSPDELLTLRRNARSFAERNLSLERFHRGFGAAIEQLLTENATH